MAIELKGTESGISTKTTFNRASYLRIYNPTASPVVVTVESATVSGVVLGTASIVSSGILELTKQPGHTVSGVGLVATPISYV